MKKIKLILLLLVIVSCVDSKEERQEKLNSEKQEYSNGLSQKHKNLIQDIFNTDKNLTISTLPAKNSIVVIQKWKNEIIPYVSINEKLENKGYDISFNSNSLDYIVVVKSEGIKNGTYTDGSNAWDTKTSIYAIDSKNDQIHLIASDYEKAPDKIQKSPYSDHSNYGARGIEGTELTNLIIDKVLR